MGNKNRRYPKWLGVECFAECCTNEVANNWLCNKHSGNVSKYGTLENTGSVFSNVEERLERFGERLSNGCVIWTRSLSDTGYGKMTISGRQHRVHKVAWELVNGKVPEGYLLDHFVCFNRACYELSHLRIATTKQNSENQTALVSTNTSGYRGVSYSKASSNWFGQVVHNGKRYSKTGFDSASKANAWVLAKRLELFTHNELDRRV